MNTDNEHSPDPAVHCAHIQEQLTQLLEHLKHDIERVSEPRFQALAETTAEVLAGLNTAYAHYLIHSETAWRT